MGLSKKQKEQKAAESAALLLKNLEDAKAVLAGLGEDASDEVRKEAQESVDAAQLAIDSVKDKPSGETVEIKFLLSPVKKFSLGYNVGETGFFEEKQAAELVEAKYAEYVK